ncbi:hypothetical protein AUB11_14845 [Salmonella enterica subsp. enterica serovar Typhimurium var. 5-]|nr:hypothetical protein [Salmonella enterica subsp. enterica serovar Typhimurium var. 5-]EBW5978914.1 hypothetical protein [Salmonella enterica subsp. enterica serovar Typhimurium var. 5-]
MGSCAAPSAKGDDKFITTDYLQQCPAFVNHDSYEFSGYLPIFASGFRNICFTVYTALFT